MYIVGKNSEPLWGLQIPRNRGDSTLSQSNLQVWNGIPWDIVLFLGLRAFKASVQKTNQPNKKHSWTPCKYFPIRKRKFCLKSKVASLSDWRRGPSGQVFFVMKFLLPVGGAIEKCLNDFLMNICFLRASICLCLLLDYLQSVEFLC